MEPAQQGESGEAVFTGQRGQSNVGTEGGGAGAIRVVIAVGIHQRDGGSLKRGGVRFTYVGDNKAHPEEQENHPEE